MGNIFRSAGNASYKIAISTDTQQYSAGSTITGKVYLDVTDPNGISASTISLQFTGEERTVVRTTQKAGSSNNHKHYARDRTSITNLVDILSTFTNNQISQGQYEFPFDFALPCQLPSSMSYSYDRSQCLIIYEVHAYLDDNDSPKSSCTIHIFDDCSNVLTNPLQFPKETQHVTYFCCLDRGSMSLAAEADKNIYKTGDPCNVTFQCQNQSTANVQQVIVQLNENIHWSAAGHSQRVRKNLSELRILGEKLTDLSAQPCTSPNEEGEPSMDRVMKYNVILNVPSMSAHTFEGTLIQVVHTISITFQTKCFMTNPMSKTRVSLLRHLVSASTSTPLVPTPSAPTPFAPTSFAPTPSAPPMDSSNDPDSVITNENSPQGLPVAIALPADWNPHVSGRFTIPIANATMMDSIK